MIVARDHIRAALCLDILRRPRHSRLLFDGHLSGFMLMTVGKDNRALSCWAFIVATILVFSPDMSIADEQLTVVINSVSASGSTCEISMHVNNNTVNHIDSVIIGVGVFDINLENLRAYAQYNHIEYASSTCTQVISYINRSPNFTRIKRCSMEGTREGDCLRMIAVSSTVSLEDAARTDAAAAGAQRQQQARCAPYVRQTQIRDACHKQCGDWRNGGVNVSFACHQ